MLGSGTSTDILIDGLLLHNGFQNPGAKNVAWPTVI